jgi:hypothetical protein
MYRKHLQRLVTHLKRALRMERRLTVEEFYQLLQLSETIIDYGRMIEVHCGYSVPYVIVEIPELESRFRETQRNIRDALALLRDMGRAEPTPLNGCWRLQLARTLPSGREGFHSKMRYVDGLDADSSDLGAA